jgi:hypothetical protein
VAVRRSALFILERVYKQDVELVDMESESENL